MCCTWADNLIIPTITELCAHIGVPNSTVGIIIGCCDIATIPATMGAHTRSSHLHSILQAVLACYTCNCSYNCTESTSTSLLL